MMEIRPVLKRAVTFATVAIIGLNLRPFITSIGPLAGSIHGHTGLGLQGMALLTMVPMLLMGVLAFVGPALEGLILRFVPKNYASAMPPLAAGHAIPPWTSPETADRSAPHAAARSNASD